MNKFQKVLITLATLTTTLILHPTTCYAVDAGAAVVIEATTGQIIFEQNAHTQLSMASTTKIMTALLTLEQDNIYDMFTVDPVAIMVEGSSMGLRTDDQVSLYALAGGMLTASGNDAANAAAVKIAGSNPDFAKLMNERAKQIGMANTNFVTPSGLDDEHHYSTAYDMAILGATAIQNPDFLALCSSTSAKLYYGNPPYDRSLSNHNKLLSYYPNAIGIKTGFTTKSGRCLVSAAEQDGVTLIVVTLNCGDDWNIHQRLYNENFPKVTTETFTPENFNLMVTAGTEKTVEITPSENLDYICINNNPKNIEYHIFCESFIYAPIKEGDKVGKIVYYINGEVCKQSDLLATQTVLETAPYQFTFAERTKQNFYDFQFWCKEQYTNLMQNRTKTT